MLTIQISLVSLCAKWLWTKICNQDLFFIDQWSSKYFNYGQDIEEREGTEMVWMGFGFLIHTQ